VVAAASRADWLSPSDPRVPGGVRAGVGSGSGYRRPSIEGWGIDIVVVTNEPDSAVAQGEPLRGEVLEKRFLKGW